MISRRHFLTGALSSLIPVDFLEKAAAFVEKTGEPFLIPRRRAARQLFASSDFGGHYLLSMGDLWEQPPQMTYREVAERCLHEDSQWWLRDNEELGLFPDDLDDFDVVVSHWCREDSPNAKAYRLLADLPPTPGGIKGQIAGELTFVDGPCPGKDYPGVEAESLVNLSLLQHRLTQLPTDIEVRIL